MEHEVVIGLEVHLQLKTRTKAFCGCSTEFGKEPNSQTCPVCLGLPGSLPVLNEEAFSYAIKVALALQCEIQPLVKFDRKNYYYPDLPKNYQISQFDKPIAYSGSVEIGAGPVRKKICVKRVHLEEDAGKLIHETKGDHSLVDYNRSGIPLLEIVTEPDMRSPQEAYEYLTALKVILEYLEVSDCDMEKGSLRCDANISVRKKGDSALGEKVEVKNMNTFKGVKAALEYESGRQVGALSAGERIAQETRLWDPGRDITSPMRTKEESHDYRYFPDPDLVPFIIDRARIDAMRRSLPELPEIRKGRFMKEYGLSEFDAGVLTSQKDLAEFFEACAASARNIKAAANWVMQDMLGQMNSRKVSITALGIRPDQLVELISMIDEGVISGTIAKEVLIAMIEKRKGPREIVESRGLTQISDTSAIEEAVRQVLASNQKTVDDVRSGKKNAKAFLVGQVMRQMKGRANPQVVNEILDKLLGA